MTSTLIGLGAAVLVLVAPATVALPGLATAVQAEATDEYVREAQSRVLLRTPTDSHPVFENAARSDVEDMIFVCGSVRLGQRETLPFLVSWKRHVALDEAMVLVPLYRGETPRTQPWLGQQILGIDEMCKGARLRTGQVSPPSPSPPDVTPEQYVETSRAEVLRQLAEIPNARIIAAGYARDATHVVVCGRALAKGEELSFSTIWRNDEPLDQGGSMIAMWGAKTPADDPRLSILSENVRSLCKSANLGHLLSDR